MKKDKNEIAIASTESKKSTKMVDKKKSAKPAKKPNRIAKFFKDLKAEVKKIVWPTRKQVLNNTVVVLIAMAASGLFIFAVDWGLSVLKGLVKLP